MTLKKDIHILLPRTRMLLYMAKKSCRCDLNVITRVLIRERQEGQS